MKKVLIALAIILVVVLLVAGGIILYGNNYVSNSGTGDIADHVDIEKNKLGTVVAVDRGLYDENGDRYEIKGINFGTFYYSIFHISN